MNHSQDGPLLDMGAEAHLDLASDRSRIEAIVAEQGGHRARVVLDPALPDLRELPDGAVEKGHWHVVVDGARLTGGAWSAERSGDQVRLGLDVTERWRPGRLPWLMRVVTTVVPVFRRWPTTYRWRAVVQLGSAPTLSSGWERVASSGAQRYRRWTRS